MPKIRNNARSHHRTVIGKGTKDEQVVYGGQEIEVSKQVAEELLTNPALNFSEVEPAPKPAGKTGKAEADAGEGQPKNRPETTSKEASE